MSVPIVLVPATFIIVAWSATSFSTRSCDIHSRTPANDKRRGVRYGGTAVAMIGRDRLKLVLQLCQKMGRFGKVQGTSHRGRLRGS